MNPLHAIYHEMGFSAKHPRLPEAVVYSLVRTCSLLIRELAAVYRRAGLSASGFNLLMLLKHGNDPDSFTQREIGTRLVISPSDMSGLIDRLERKGLVQRIAGKDRRSKLLRIAPKGSALLDQVWPEHLQVIDRIAARLHRDRQAGLVASLHALRTPGSR